MIDEQKAPPNPRHFWGYPPPPLSGALGVFFSWLLSPGYPGRDALIVPSKPCKQSTKWGVFFKNKTKERWLSLNRS